MYRLFCLFTVVCFALLTPVFAQEAPHNWHKDAFFGLHYDLHPNAGDTELGRETTYEHIREMLEIVRPDFVQYDCKGHPGYTGYPTEIGSPSPGIVNDALAVWREVTRDMGLPLSVHYSGVWDTRAIELNPDWARVNQHGEKDTNNTCRTSAYDAELMIPQLLDVVARYDIDGMWIDGENWASHPCWCDRCAEAFRQKSGMEVVPQEAGEPHWDAWLAFHRNLFIEHVRAVVDAVHAAKPTCMVTSNWMYSLRQPEPMEVNIDYLSGDFTPSFGAETASAEARFISSRGKPWDLMAWGFLRVGDQGWTVKTPVHLCQELSQVLAQGGALFIYNQPQRSGRLTRWHQETFAAVADFCRARKEYSFQTETVPQVAVLHSETSYYKINSPLFNPGAATQAVEGALHGLLENGYSVDLLNEATLLDHLDEYPAVVVPEAREVPSALREALAGYVARGGRLLVVGDFAAAQYGELAGVSPGEGQATGYLPVMGQAVTVQGGFQRVNLAGAEVLAHVLSQQDPDVNATDLPAATRHRVGEGVVAAVHGPVFTSYYRTHYPLLRRFIGDMVAALDAPLMQLHAPSHVELAARKKDGRTLLQLVNRGNSGYLAPNRHMVEHVPDTGPFSITVPMAEKPRRVFTAPDQVGVEWAWQDGQLQIQLAGLHIHNVVVIE
jgi:hypothetical protein